ncbi:hypothetical protein GCM10010451_52240 [Streptomyces virens]|uniref:Uncharacterized protein n=1 Tax=Streptomyces virens TaxID=285572 RepID=A0ABP6PYQ9_9ACTN
MNRTEGARDGTYDRAAEAPRADGRDRATGGYVGDAGLATWGLRRGRDLAAAVPGAGATAPSEVPGSGVTSPRARAVRGLPFWGEQ